MNQHHVFNLIRSETSLASCLVAPLLIIIIGMLSAQCTAAPDLTSSEYGKVGNVSFVVPHKWKTLKKSDTAQAFEAPYRATDGRPESANVLITLRPDLADDNLTTESDEVPRASAMDDGDIMMNDLVAAGSPWRTLVWLSKLNGTHYVVVDCIALTSQPAMARFAFPLMDSTEGFDNFLEQANATMDSLTVGGSKHLNGSFEAVDGLLRFRTRSYDHINPTIGYDFAVVYAPEELNPTDKRAIKRRSSNDWTTPRGQIKVGDASVGRFRR